MAESRNAVSRISFHSIQATLAEESHEYLLSGHVSPTGTLRAARGEAGRMKSGWSIAESGDVVPRISLHFIGLRSLFLLDLWQGSCNSDNFCEGVEMKKTLVALGTCVCLLSGCSMTLPVKGQMHKSDETFKGTATGYIDGGGDLTIILNKGARCTGNFVYVTRRNGEGVFKCDDGRSGPFKFVSTGTRGTGYGDLDGERFTFTFGNQ